MRRAPGLFTASRDGETGGKLIDRLEGEADIDAPGELRGDSLAEVLFEVGPDDEDDFPEAGADGIEDRVVEDGLAGGSHRVDLFQAAVAASHAGSEDEEGRFHVREIGGGGR